jgi:hypothetical protein
MGIMPTSKGERLFQAADALVLAGLSRAQLREWCGKGRRMIMKPDVSAQGSGRVALYSWRTLVVLRVLHHLQTRYSIEVSAWTGAAAEFRAGLDACSFPAAWQCAAQFGSSRSCTLVADADPPKSLDGLFIPLEPHMAPMAAAMAIPRPDQLPLFPLVAVRR